MTLVVIGHQQQMEQSSLGPTLCQEDLPPCVEEKKKGRRKHFHVIMWSLRHPHVKCCKIPSQVSTLFTELDKVILIPLGPKVRR